ncbi:phosphotransferase [Streptomyces sp. ODS28]|uniref:phosphotransferase n=1 Tax=Streptomyces sp. ODS28 TaxID=3136688 RepID=UPI0031E606FF
MQPSHPPLPAHTLRTLVDRYAAGQPLSCRPVAQGLLNRGYQLATTRGRFFLKHHLDGEPEAIGRQHHATARLAAHGLPVVPPVPDAEGGTVTVLGGDCFALHPWIDGRHRHGCELSRTQSRRLGALLGRVHTQLARVIPAEPAPPHPSADPEDSYEVIGELLARVRARSAPDAFDELAERRLVERRALLRRCAGQRPPEGGEPVAGWVHGDFHPLNLLYGEDAPDGSGAGEGRDPVAIVDWDRLGVQPRAEEAVRAAVIFFLRPDGTLDLRRVRAYARAYREAAGADAGELGAAVHRVWWERLNDFWMLRWRYQLSDPRADPLFPPAAALVQWWTTHYDPVRNAFAD